MDRRTVKSRTWAVASVRSMRRARPARRKRFSRMAGSRPSPKKFLGERAALIAAAVLLLGGASARAPAQEKANAPLRPYAVVGDAIPASLTGARGDPERGREIVVNR